MPATEDSNGRVRSRLGSLKLSWLVSRPKSPTCVTCDAAWGEGDDRWRKLERILESGHTPRSRAEQFQLSGLRTPFKSCSADGVHSQLRLLQMPLDACAVIDTAFGSLYPSRAASLEIDLPAVANLALTATTCGYFARQRL